MNEIALWEHVRVNDLAVELAIIASNSMLNFYLSKFVSTILRYGQSIQVLKVAFIEIIAVVLLETSQPFIDFNNFPSENRLEMCS